MKCPHCNKETGTRTLPQNSGMHVFFKLLADAMNHAGLTIPMVLKETYEIHWTPKNVKGSA